MLYHPAVLLIRAVCVHTRFAFLCCSLVRLGCCERRSCEVPDLRAKGCRSRLVDVVFDPGEKLEIEAVLNFRSINR